MALGPCKRWIKICPPSHLIPDLVALDAIEEYAEVEVLIGGPEVDAIIEFRVGIAEKSTVRLRDLAVPVDIRIAEPAYTFIGLIDCGRITRSMLRSSIRVGQIICIVPEARDLISIKRSHRMPYLVTDELAAKIPAVAGQEVIGALRHLGHFVVEGSKRKHG